MMTIETLKLFRDLADTGSFSRAAELNGVTQSAVSQQLKKLERTFRCPLVNRGRDGVTLTDEGASLYEAAKKISAVYSSAIDSIAKSQPGKAAGSVRISTIYSTGLYLLQGYISRFMSARPEIKVSVEYRQSEQVYGDVQAGRADFGFLACPTKKQGDLVFLPLCAEEMMLAVPERSEAAHGADIGRDSLADMDFVLFDKVHPSRKFIDDFFSKEGLPLRVKMGLDDIETIKTAVRSGVGVSILPVSAFGGGDSRGIKAVRFRDLDLRRTVYLLRSRTRKLSPAARHFLDTVFEKGKSICPERAA
ncbi:MAG TPA: LysR family transcriptional regulator [Elusimicrobiales bacterium]|nr:LysR family transcriptional regulator [Elusimicrobiales bacterium]